MDNRDREAIEDLFRKLGDVEQQAGSKDGEAQALIDSLVARQPAAPYFMAQTVVMQEYALNDAQKRIEELEALAAQQQPAQQGGGFLSSIFGNPGGTPGRSMGSVPSVGRSPLSPPPGMSPAQAGQGGGFLAGAAQTAMGVAGGVLLGNAIGSMFGTGEAKAATPATPATQAEPTPAADQPDTKSDPDPDPEPEAEEEEGGFFDSMFGGDEEL